MRMLLISALCALSASPALAQPVQNRPDVDAVTLEVPGGERILRESIVVAAPQAEVWKLFATSGGLKRWEAPVASIDLRPGGMLEASYDPKAKLGDPGNIKHVIVTYLPGSLLVFRNVQTPKGFPWPEQFGRVTSIIQLEPVDATHTRITVAGVGYRPADQALYEFFRSGNAYLLEVLKSVLEGLPPPTGPAH